MVPETVIQAVASLNEAMVDGAAEPVGQDLLVVKLDGRQWLLYPQLDGSGSWTVALPTPRGDPEPGSELLLPLTGGEKFPWVWWTRFCEATDPLPEPLPGAHCRRPVPGRTDSQTEPANLDSMPGRR